MPGEQLRVDVVQESPGLRERFPASLTGDLPDAPDGQGVDRRLAKAAREGRRGRGVGRLRRGGGPVLGAGEVALRWGLLVEDDVGDLAGRPLVVEERDELAGGAPGVELGQADGDKRRVPAPLVRVEIRRGLRPFARVVAV